jgi:hypothetical protein
MFRRHKNDKASALDLQAVGRMVRERMERIQRQSVQPALVIARLADSYRDVGIEPLPPTQVQAMLSKLDEEGWRRLDLIVSVMSSEAAGDALRNVKSQDEVAEQIKNVFLPLVKKKRSVALGMTSESPLRIEEFARQLAAGLNVRIKGETASESAKRLERLDYERLMIDSELSKLTGKERSDYFMALHRAERGKW